MAAPVPTAVRAAFDFRRSQLQLRADVGRNRKQRLLRGARAGLNGLAGVDHEIGERALRILDMGLDPERQFLGAGHQAVAGLPSAALDAARHGFDARAEQIFKLRDPGIDVVGDGADPALDALMDFLEPRRDGVGQLGAAASMVAVTFEMRWSTASIAWAAPSVSEEVSWVRRASIEWIACAAPSVSVEVSVPSRLSMVSVTEFARVSNVCSSDLRRPSIDSSNDLILLSSEVSRSADAGAERGLELHQALIERGGDLAAVRGQAGVESVDIGLQRFGDILGALTHAIDDLAAEGFDGAVEFRDVAGDQRAERAAVASEFLREFAALVLHQFVERAHLQGERIVRGLGLADDLRHQ